MFSKLNLTKVIFSTIFLSFATLIGGASISYAAEPTIQCFLPDKSTIKTTEAACKAAKGRVK